MSLLRGGGRLRLAGAGLGVLVAALLLIGSRLSGLTASVAAPPPVLTVISVPIANSSPTATPQPTLIPAPPGSPTPEPQSARQFTLGEFVEVYGTQGDGLRIRESPGLEATILILGLESEVFQVVEGPVISDGLSWWRITNPYDPTETGWAADSFLRSFGP